MLASLGALTASSNVKLAWVRDKAQFVLTSLHGGINIAAASLFPSARRLLFLLSLPPPLSPPLPERTIYRRSMPFQNIYSLCIGWIQRPFSTPLWCLTFKQTTCPRTCTCWPHPHQIALLLSLHHAFSHTLVYWGDSSLPKPSIWFMPLTDLKVGEGKQV